MGTLFYKVQNYGYSIHFKLNKDSNNPFFFSSSIAITLLPASSISCQDSCSSLLTDLSKFSLSPLKSAQFTLSGVVFFFQYAGLTTSLSPACNISIVPYSDHVWIKAGRAASYSWKATNFKFDPTSKWGHMYIQSRDTLPGLGEGAHHTTSKWCPITTLYHLQYAFNWSFVSSVIILWTTYLY